MVMVVPAPAGEKARSLPLWPAKIRLAMERPRPVPPRSDLVVKKGSKIRPRFSAGMPGPESATEMVSVWSCAAVSTVRLPRSSMASSALVRMISRTCFNSPSLP